MTINKKTVTVKEEWEKMCTAYLKGNQTVKEFLENYHTEYPWPISTQTDLYVKFQEKFNTVEERIEHYIEYYNDHKHLSHDRLLKQMIVCASLADADEIFTAVKKEMGL